MKPLSLLQWTSRSALLALALALMVLPSAHATKLRKQNLTQLIGQADSIIAGTVKGVSDGIDAKGVPYTEVTISVGISAKGKVAHDQDYTFRQFGLRTAREYPNGHKLLAMTPEAFPSWREGEYIVAFLYRPAARTGLQTTVGLAQGKLTMVNERLSNQFGNVGLFEDVQIDAALLSADEQAMLQSSGAVDMRTFMGLVERAIEGQWIEKGEMK